MLPAIVSKLAPLITIIENIPLLHKTLKHKRVRDLSFFTILLMFLSGIVWLLHGYFIQDFTLIVSSLAVTVVNSIMMGIYLLFS